METSTIILLIVIAVIMVYLISSIRILGPSDMGALTLFGKPVKFINSGLAFVPFGIYKLYVFSKKIYTIKFQIPTILTQDGRVKGYNDDRKINSAEITLACELLFFLPQNNDLFKTLEAAPDNTPHNLQGSTAKDFADVFIAIISDIAKSDVGSAPYPLVNWKREKIAQLILSKLVPGIDYHEIQVDEDGFYSFSSETKKSPPPDEMPANNRFLQFGIVLDSISLNITDVIFSDAELARAMSSTEVARLKAVVTETAADAAAYARAKMIEVIKSNPDLELLDALKKMAEGQGTILYQLPEGLGGKLSGLMGGSTSSDLMDGLKKLKPEDWAMISGLIKNLKP